MLEIEVFQFKAVYIELHNTLNIFAEVIKSGKS